VRIADQGPALPIAYEATSPLSGSFAAKKLPGPWPLSHRFSLYLLDRQPANTGGTTYEHNYDKGRDEDLYEADHQRPADIREVLN
jgi:hypothetical protein